VTEREYRLRQRIDTLSAEVRAAKARAAKWERDFNRAINARGDRGRRLARCVWCGCGCYGKTCRECRVLENRLREVTT
jgi:hypothetical protein